MKRKMTAMSFVPVLLALASIVFAVDAVTVTPAATASANNIVSSVIGFITTNLFPAIEAVALAGLAYLSKKYGVPLIGQILLQKVATSTIHAIEEKGASALVKGGPKIASEVKLSQALDIVTKYTGVTPEVADTAIHAAISQAPDIGATAKVQDIVNKLNG